MLKYKIPQIVTLIRNMRFSFSLGGVAFYDLFE